MEAVRLCAAMQNSADDKQLMSKAAASCVLSAARGILSAFSQLLPYPVLLQVSSMPIVQLRPLVATVGSSWVVASFAAFFGCG